MEVTVKLVNGNSFKLELEREDTILRVKEKFQNIEGVPRNIQKSFIKVKF